VIPDRHLDLERVLAASVRVPDHVVYREFAQETVLLNLETGQYHGVNPTGGKMLDSLDRAATVGDSAAELAGHFGRDRAEMEQDVCSFCIDLLERGLVELDEPA
jgi:Coenzyme PQQ synthesis protein D (PqqD)